MAGDSALVKQLRQKTGAGIMDCKQALVENGDDINKAIDWLRQKGLAAAGKKAGRATNEGVIASYIHPGSKVGVLIEVNCETDFVARNDEFHALVRDLTLQIAASKPLYVRREDVPQSVIDKELEIYRGDRKSTRLNSSHGYISYAVFCLKKKNSGTRSAQKRTRPGTSDGPRIALFLTNNASRRPPHSPPPVYSDRSSSSLITIRGRTRTS